jgi:hypothetical protein
MYKQSIYTYEMPKSLVIDIASLKVNGSKDYFIIFILAWSLSFVVLSRTFCVPQQ